MIAEPLLELLNGGSIIPEFLCLMVLALYLSREARRRGLHALDWIHLPPSMDLVLAIFVCDLGSFSRTVIAWAWRLLGAGDFNSGQAVGLVAGGTLAAIGFLCKIRALTRPDYGNGPWFVAAALSLAAAALLVYFGDLNILPVR